MKRNQNRNLGELITIFLDNGDLTEDDVMPLLKKGTASSMKEKEEKIFVQPLTEGEGETKIGIISSTEYRQGYWPGCKKENFINQHQKPQQESNKEEDECCHGCSTGKGCEKSEEPSKKPSERIEEMLENLIGQPAYQSMFATIVAYLDELHKAGKI